jgi:hypothetical protein
VEKTSKRGGKIINQEKGNVERNDFSKFPCINLIYIFHSNCVPDVSQPEENESLIGKMKNPSKVILLRVS